MVKIMDMLPVELKAQFVETNNGNFKGPCPSCGKKDNYSGMTIFPQSNTAYCHGSKTIFNILEFLALIKGKITCREGRQKI